ncbi:MAG: hypothetical protein HYU64_12355 [Armatimonadetes bacterium]|nr:hypothetical protein [Armatimonadota bacterium]
MTDKIFVRGVSPEIWRKAKVQAAAKDLKMAQVIEESLKMWLGIEDAQDASGVNWESLTAIGKSGLKDVSEKHDYYLSLRKPKET